MTDSELLIIPMRIFNFIKAVVTTFREARGSYLAASIAYFIVLSLIPFLLIVVSVSGFIIHGVETEFSLHLISLVQSSAPTLTDSIQKCIEFATTHKQILGLIGILAFFYTVKGLISSLDFGLNQVLKATTQKPYLHRWLDTIMILFILLLLFIFSMCLMLFISYVNVIPIARNIPHPLWQVVRRFFPYLVCLIVSVVLFYAIYRIIPVAKPTHKKALMGALVGAIIWQVINGIFSWYLMKQTLYYQIIYGSFAALIYIILWAYLGAISILIGGAIIKVIMSK